MVSGGHNKKSIEHLKTTGSYRRHSREHQERERIESQGTDFCSRPVPGTEPLPVPKKWIRDAGDRQAVKDGCWFDRKQGKYACDWIEKHCTITEGEKAGEPFKLLPWQRDVVMRLFGWMRYDAELRAAVRRFQRAFVFIPKKNGKTPFAAAISLLMLFGDSRSHGCNCFIAATDKNQGSICGYHAIRMIKQNERLLAVTGPINEGKQALRAYVEQTNSSLQTLPATPERLEGLNGVCLVMDELHAWKGDRAYNALRFFAATRPEPITFIITTAGDDLETICRKQYDYAKAVQAGTVVDTSYLPIIFEAPEGSRWDTLSTWKRANPSLGHVLRQSEIASAATEAAGSLRAQNVFRRYRINHWVTGFDPWLDPDAWQQCGDPYDERTMEGESCWGALDLAKTRDTTALALQFFDAEADLYRQLVWYWLPEVIVRKRAHLASFQQWAADGVLELTPGNVCDYDYIFDRVAQLADMFSIQAVAYDPYNAESVTRQIESDLGIERVAFGQSISNVHPAASEYERRVLEGTMRHNCNPLLSWQAGHVQVDPHYFRKKLIRPVRPSTTAGDYRTIDGVMASVMALGLQLKHKPKRCRNKYAKQKVRVL